MKRSLFRLSGLAMLAGAGLLVGLLAGVAPPAGAGIYKCTHVDGSTSFVSDPSGCVGRAEPHQLKKKFQRAAPAASRERAARPAAAAGGTGAGTPGEADVWRKKKAEAQARLAQAEEAVRYLRGAAKGCNRGGNWYRKTDSGIREHVPCDEIKGKLEEAEKAQRELRSYVNGGIEDDCRRAGCLPGWLR